MFNAKNLSVGFILLYLVAGVNTVFADNVVNHKDLSQEELESIYLGHNFECEWKDQYNNSGTKLAVFESVTPEKAVAKGKTSVCPDGWDTTELHFKGKKIKVKVFDRPEGCVDVKGKYKLYKKSDGSYYHKGNFTYMWQGSPINGNETCKAVPK